MNSITNDKGNGKTPTVTEVLIEQLARLERRLARLERRGDEAIGAYLNAKFPYGKATDRWSRRG